MPLSVAVLDADGSPVTVLTLDAIAAILGEVAASPTANTLLDRLKTIATLLAAATPAGANIIGAVKTDQTTHGTTDLVAADITKVAGAAVSQGHGVAATAIRVELPTDGTGVVGLNAGTNVVGAFKTDQTTHGTTDLVAADITKVAGSAIQQGHGVAAAAIRVELPTDGTGVVARITNGGLVGSVETGTIYNGTTVLVPKFAKIAANISGNNELVAAVTSKKIRVLAYNFIGAGAVNAKFQSGASGTDLTGLKPIDAAGGGISVAFCPVGWFETVAGASLNMNLDAGVMVGGELVYVEV